MRAAYAEVVLAAVVLASVAAPTAAQTVTSTFAGLQGRLKADQTVYVQTAAVTDARGRGIKGKAGILAWVGFGTGMWNRRRRRKLCPVHSPTFAVTPFIGARRRGLAAALRF